MPESQTTQQQLLSIDLNADLGEGASCDGQILALVSSANIACGGHAGDEDSMRVAVQLAQQYGVTIGAHPSFADKENFGRKIQTPPYDHVAQDLRDQISSLIRIATEHGAHLRHVKPHGALYNQAAFDPILADIIIQVMQDIAPQLSFVALAGSPIIGRARAAGLQVISEAFADRRYRTDGSLVPRSQANACIEHRDEAVAQSLQLIKKHQLCTVDGDIIKVQADTICVHGDGVHALATIQALRAAFDEHGIEVTSQTKASSNG
ncbi:5-oxoprolinase subunit PxpA [Undibacterium sp. Di24W]|uniref:5-oxoprolinase subunit PxpA n=1 Tax=Undibacterium sp. Di24W TaxID=3413033 RepID=UPI003BF1D507